MAEKRNKRAQSLIRLTLVAGIIIFVNILANFFFAKVDLTQEKRYTLTQSTRNLLNQLQEPVYVRVLLEGEFPAGFKQLQRGTQELLSDFRSETTGFAADTSGGIQGWLRGVGRFFTQDARLEYRFEDPNAGTTEEINLRRQELAKSGIMPTLFRVKGVEGTEEKLIYPYAICMYQGREVVVNLLENEPGLPQEEVIEQSLNQLEYKFANAIQKLQLARKPIIAFTTGQGEAEELQTKDLVSSLRAFYDFGRFHLDSNYQIPAQIELLIVLKPTLEFSEQDKFKLDQYVMNGGKILWLIDRLDAELDSMQNREFFVPRDYPTNLEDLLFRYGARVEPNLVLDLQCSQIPQVIGMQGGNPQIELFPWYYHPVVTPVADHPVVRGLEAINLYFPSRVDTIKTKVPIEKTVLLTSSDHSMEQYSPVRLSFEILRYDAEPERFKKQYLPFAVLLEGQFPSLYENRVTDAMKEMMAGLGTEFRALSEPTRMMVVSDGDIGINLITNAETRGVLPLGYNRFEKRQYDNKNFLVNAIEYLLDDSGVIEARGKEIKLRLLDGVKAEQQKSLWQFVNIGLPLLFLLAFGLIYQLLRKRRYEKIKL